MSTRYQVELVRSVTKDLKKLDKKTLLKVAVAIDNLQDNSFPIGFKKLKGINNLYRIRHGNYRIIYTVKNTALTVLILKVGHRREVYKI